MDRWGRTLFVNFSVRSNINMTIRVRPILSKIAVTAGKLISDIGNNTMLSMGYYQYEVVSVQSPYREWYSHKTTTLYGIENDTKYYQNINKYGGIYGGYFGQ